MYKPDKAPSDESGKVEPWTTPATSNLRAEQVLVPYCHQSNRYWSPAVINQVGLGILLPESEAPTAEYSYS